MDASCAVATQSGNTFLKNDYLNTPECETAIQAFFRATNSTFNVVALAPIIETLQQSSILSYVMRAECGEARAEEQFLRNFIRSRPHLPQDFVNRFLAVIALRINVSPSSYAGLSGSLINRSYVAKITRGNVRPPTVVTQFSVQSLRNALREETRRGVNTHVAAARREIIPYEYKPVLDRDVLSSLINCQSDLCKAIAEGNRQNGRAIDPYVKSKIRYE